MKQWLLILGANSDIAISSAKVFAQKGFNIYLASRNLDDLEKAKKDLEVRYVEVSFKICSFDAIHFSSHKAFYENLEPKPVGVILSFGYMEEQEKAQESFDIVRKTIDTNYVGAISILEIIANDFEKKKNGFIIGISSVAGDRGRKSNYIYGSAKSGFSEYLSGLRNRLFSSGVQVITVKPGFVDTKMTRGLDLPKALLANSDDVAKDIYKAYTKKKDIIYTKKIWRLIMLIIRHIPEAIFKRLSL